MRKRILTAFVLIALMSLTMGISYSWLVNKTRLASVAKIHPSTLISIQGPNESILQSIDLSYDKDDVDGDGIVRIKRPLVIKSESKKYDLCISHTSNINGLDIKLYEALDNGTEGNAYIAGINSNGVAYFWNLKDGVNLFTEDGYINLESSSEGKAVANNNAHTQTYVNYDNVQKNAEPLYWVKKNIQSAGTEAPYYTNYVLEISWDETDKETDILYVIARTVE